MFVKIRPTSILPSACTAIESTSPLAFRIKRVGRAGCSIEPRDFVSRLPADRAEMTAYQNLAVDLNRNALHKMT